MLNTYIKNKGTTKTLIYNNNENHVKELNWDVDYDGKVADVDIYTNEDGIQKKYDFQFTNDDLNQLLNYPTVNIPLHKRLKNDFKTLNNKQIYVKYPSTYFPNDKPLIIHVNKPRTRSSHTKRHRKHNSTSKTKKHTRHSKKNRRRTYKSTKTHKSR